MIPTDPTTEIGEWQRVNPLSIAVQSLRGIVQALIPIAFMVYGIANEGTGDGGGGLVFFLVALGVLLLIAATVGIGWLGWYRLRYRIGENDVRVEQGIVSRSARSVPYDRIQDVSLEQKILPRLLGLVEVKFETGAGGKEELKLAYVAEEEGERLRETVRSLVEGADPRLAADAPPTDDEAMAAPSAPAARQLFAMGPRRLFVFGLFSFSLVVFAVLMGAAQQLEFLLPFDAWDRLDAWLEDKRYAEATGYIAGYGAAAQIAAILTAVATVIVVGIASGLVTTFVRDWGFLLERTAKGFRRRRGLLTKTDVVMPVHRVQALVVKTGWLRRRFGWHGLSFISLAQDSGSANHDVAPFAKMHEIASIASESGFTLPDETVAWCRPNPNYYFVRGLAFALLVMLLVIVVAAAASFWWIVAIGLVLAAAQGLRSWYLWRVERHALDPAQVLSRRGWLAPRLQIASRVKLHSAGIRQGPLGRWLGYCDLHLGLAGGRMAFRGLRRDDAMRLRAAVLESIARVDFAHLPR